MSETELEAAVQTAESEGMKVPTVEKVEAKVDHVVETVEGVAPAVESRVLVAIAAIEKHIQTIEAELEAASVHERTAVWQYVLSLKTRIHSLLLRI